MICDCIYTSNKYFLKSVLFYDKDTYGLTDFSGLGLFEGILVCHYTEDRKEHFEELKTCGGYMVLALTNEESVLIEN